MELETRSQPEVSAPLEFIRSPTPQLRAFISQQAELLTGSQFEELLSDIKNAFDRFTSKLLMVSAGIDRAMLLHRMMNHELEAASQLTVSCTKGCSGCCHYEVEVTTDEGALLAEVVRTGFPLDFERLEIQAGRERKSAEWSKFWNKDNRCVFLGEEGACQIYNYRPAICRKHLVVSPAKSCTTPGDAVTPVNMPLCEILLSAALSIDGVSSSSLSKMLVRSLEALPAKQTQSEQSR